MAGAGRRTQEGKEVGESRSRESPRWESVVGRRVVRRANTCPARQETAGGPLETIKKGTSNLFETLQGLMTTTSIAAGGVEKGSRRRGRKAKRRVTQFPAKEVRGVEPEGVDGDGPTHLCVLVHGLGGTPFDWTAIRLEFQKFFTSKGGGGGAVGGIGAPRDGMLVHVSQANSFLKTFDGIDTCGGRLAEEIKDIVREQPSLKTLSVVGHSLGGLISRYALGVLYCQETGTMYGLRPRHFATIVSPHLGCDASSSSENEVPFLRYLTGIPIIGAGIGLITNVAAAPGAALLYRRTGRQLFMKDAMDPNMDGLPVVFQLAVNGLSEEIIDYHYNKYFPADSTTMERRKKLIPFGKALAAFKSRTLYSNVQGDHMVSWPNASIRKVSEMPAHLLGVNKKGIVEETNSKSQSQRENKLKRKVTIDITSHTRLQDIMIESLQKLSWKRVDVKLDIGANKIPHNYIQARPADEQSLSVTKHLMNVLSN
ncbi:alpha/beta-hydrolase [Chloropicon primus]|uniref:Alpha/beta-hydrolase n=1 Tax=Chloropicon primus TaxID=1764295 RepID=A0A5B8MVP6_9CHLO|nr:alpha/beta-hydrolase [Chloropicon primus]UPR03696.1 alpha/beta-hydrolase [Chloropicon primus]|eukprot:QDZ24487.1 alpha/beta-hydrolase [Chloropicon primus]